MAATDAHARPADDILSELASTRDGLSVPEAARRLRDIGPNRIEPAPPVPAWRILVDQLTSMVVLLLVAAAVISFLLADLIEVAAILAVLAINTALGFWTELRARRAMEALAAFDEGRATVVRDARLERIPAGGVVPGDILELHAGERIAADGRIVSETDLRVDEAPLTGESVPVSKDAGTQMPADTALADRRTMVYKGTATVAGTARVVVTATGAQTEIGRIGTLVGGMREERTPLERRLDVLGRQLAWLAIAVAVVVSGLGALQGAPLGLVLELGIALAVAAVPEALPVVATIALAIGLNRMARREALVRRLPAVEALGSTTVVCTDKTRTLTSGDMTIVEVWTRGTSIRLDQMDDRTARRDAVSDVLLTASLASRVQADPDEAGPGTSGDPVDRASVDAAARVGIDRAGWVADHPQAGVVPFSSERQLQAAFHRDGDRLMSFVKGAPQRVVALCGSQMAVDGPVGLDDDGRNALLAENEQMAARGLRVLAVARGTAGTDEASLGGLTLLGFIGLLDPPAPGVRETIAKLREAGLRTIMLTGDQRLTAQAIGRELGLETGTDAVLDGRDVDRLGADALGDRVGRVSVFSRISPEHKLRIIEALQGKGEIVAMLGDGINDAPALKRADVGVAMGRRGTDVAREAAAMVLRDDRFETIAAAVEEGRVIYDNIRKFVFYLFSCNLAEVLVLLGAGLAGLPLPLLPLQILWLNMVTDTVPALALAMEPADPTVMKRPPRRPDEALLSRRFLGSMAFYSLLITAVTLAAFVLTLDDSAERARTVAFMTLTFAQIFHLGNARSVGPVVAFHRAIANRYAVGALVLSVALQVAAFAVPPVADVLRLRPLSGEDVLLIAGLSAIPAVIGQIIKTVSVAR
jgi:Ca2+-transporting ATPase